MRLAATAAGAALLLVLSAALNAQWLNYPTPGGAACGASTDEIHRQRPGPA